MTPCSAAWCPHTRGALPRSSSAASGFFFCGMIDDPDDQASDSVMKPNSALVHRTTSWPSRLRCVAHTDSAWSRSRAKSRLETASTELGTTPAKPSSSATIRRSVSKFTPASAPAPSGNREVALQHRIEALDVAGDHPEVGEQMVRQVHGLRTLQMRVARERPVQMPLGRLEDDESQLLQVADRLLCGATGEHRQVGDDLVVTRATRVDPAARRAGQLGHPAFDGHVDVLVVFPEGEGPRLQLPCDDVQRAEDLVPVGVVDDRLRREHPHMRPDCATSCGQRRRSKPSDVLSAWKAASWGSEKRDMRRRSLWRAEPMSFAARAAPLRRADRGSARPAWRGRSPAGTA